MTDADLEETVESMVRSGLLERVAVVEMAVEVLMDENLDLDLDTATKRASDMVEQVIAAQVEREAGWTEPTDVDRLLAVFSDLQDSLILVFEDHDVDVRSGHQLARELVTTEHDPMLVRGYVFYTQQDLAAVVQGGPLLLAFGGWGFNATQRIRNEVVDLLRSHDFDVAHGTANDRIVVPLTWKRRGWADGRLNLR